MRSSVFLIRVQVQWVVDNPMIISVKIKDFEGTPTEALSLKVNELVLKYSFI